MRLVATGLELQVENLAGFDGVRICRSGKVDITPCREVLVCMNASKSSRVSTTIGTAVLGSFDTCACDNESVVGDEKFDSDSGMMGLNGQLLNSHRVPFANKNS